MTGRQRILAAFCGECPDVVPYSPNIYHWFYSRRAAGTLPAELAACGHPLDVLQRLGCDALIRWDAQAATRAVYTAGEYSHAYDGRPVSRDPVTTAFNIYPPGTSRRRQRFVTPYGALSQLWTYSEDARADFVSEYWWKDWSEFKAVRFLLESTRYEFDAVQFQRCVDRVGDDGVVMVHATESPLKRFHWLAGPENASLFIADHPDEMRELARIHEEAAIALVRSTVDHPAAQVFVSLDNLDTAFYPPYLYRDYCESFFSRAAEIIHARGKIFVVHACGRNRLILPLAGRSRVDCLEGLTPPPLGDVELGEARQLACYENFTVNGGIDLPRMEMAGDAEAGIHAYTRGLFESMGDKRHFIFASSCSTSTCTPWENLVHFRNAAREYGRITA